MGADRAVLELFLALVGTALVVVNASLWMAWIVIGKHSRLLKQDIRRISDLEELEMRRTRKEYGIPAGMWSGKADGAKEES